MSPCQRKDSDTRYTPTDSAPFNYVKIAVDIFEKVLHANSGSVFTLKTTAVIAPTDFQATRLVTPECVLNIIVKVPERRWEMTNIETFIFSGLFAYVADYKTSVIMVWPKSSVKFPTLSNCKYRTISTRIFTLVLELTYHNVIPSVIDVRWGFYCHFCSGQVWISLHEVDGISEFVELKHLSLRRRLDRKRFLFNLVTGTDPFRKRISTCEASPWVTPSNPCPYYRMIPEFLSSKLNLSFNDYQGFLNLTCGVLHLAVIDIQKRHLLTSLRLKFQITTKLKYCEFGGSLKTRSLRLWAWVTPFKLSVWITLLLIMMASAIAIGAIENGIHKSTFSLLTTKFMSNLFIVVAVCFRQICGTNTKLKWVLHISMIASLAVYESYFTSTIVVPSKVERNPSFVSLLKMGYKIGFKRASTNNSTDISGDAYLNRYDHVFEKLGIAGWIRNKKFFYGTKRLTRTQIKNRTLKIMMAFPTQQEDKKIARAEQEVGNARSKIQCRFTPEIFYKTENYEMAFLSVRVEVLSLLGAIREFGFFEFWKNNVGNVFIYNSKKMTRRLLREQKVFADHTESLRYEDLIRIDNLLSLFIIFGLCISFGLATFLFEKFHINGYIHK
ncbi:hypothetical protein Fcan01_17045 [Folsomia candida]|uniref:Uncharacterized protein n=1 Tax=Folsomia candida TaxID=158441 RepID=A0A226DRH1_FOLCA|nr:hypothetical protein Fcan01_17045 [Folsomia candida]